MQDAHYAPIINIVSAGMLHVHRWVVSVEYAR